ncbi:MAG: Hpt domain-containing protein [Luteolibacter sp.]
MIPTDDSSPHAGSLLDMKQFKAMSDGLGEDLGSIISDYFASCVELTAKLAEAVRLGDVEKFRDVCHEIKGASGLLGFRAIAQITADWESSAIEGHIPKDVELPKILGDLVIETKTRVNSLTQAETPI